MPTPEKQREYQQRYLAKPGTKAKRAALNRAWIENNRERYNELKAKYRARLKLEALKQYANGKPRCAQCGYDKDLDALCLDHIENNGQAHRTELKISGRGLGAGTTIYERLKALGWLPGLQVLCFNCNAVKEIRRKRGGKSAADLLT